MNFLRKVFPNEAERVRRWPAIRAKGIARFILLRGVLYWSVLLLVFLPLGMWVLPPHVPPNAGSFLLLPIVLIVGALMGWVLWLQREAEHRSAQRRAEGLLPK